MAGPVTRDRNDRGQNRAATHLGRQVARVKPFSILLHAFLLTETTSSRPGAQLPPPIHKCPEAEMPTVEGAWRFTGRSGRAPGLGLFKLGQEKCTVCLSGELDKVYQKIGGWPNGVEFSVRHRVEGGMSHCGRFGHDGMWERELRVRRVISVESTSE